MWLMTNKSFVSIVEHRDDPNLLCVRGRFKGDVDQFLGRKVEVETPDADYRFRAVAPRTLVGERMLIAVGSVDYPNFKNSVREKWRHDAYLDVWGVMWREQKARVKATVAKVGKRFSSGGVVPGAAVPPKLLLPGEVMVSKALSRKPIKA